MTGISVLRPFSSILISLQLIIAIHLTFPSLLSIAWLISPLWSLNFWNSLEQCPQNALLKDYSFLLSLSHIFSIPFLPFFHVLNSASYFFSWKIPLLTYLLTCSLFSSNTITMFVYKIVDFRSKNKQNKMNMTSFFIYNLSILRYLFYFIFSSISTQLNDHDRSTFSIFFCMHLTLFLRAQSPKANFPD